MCGKYFSNYGVYASKKCIESMQFYSCPSSPLRSLGRTFCKFVSSKTKGVEKKMICFIKIQSESKKMTWNISLFIFCMIYICFTVLWIICNSVVWSLLPFLRKYRQIQSWNFIKNDKYRNVSPIYISTYLINWKSVYQENSENFIL